MFQCYLGIITVSSNKRVAEIIRAADMPEDCSAAVMEADCLSEPVEGKDMAVIFDGIEAYRKNCAFSGNNTRIVLMTSDPSQVLDVKDNIHELWVVPEGCGDELISFYADRLICTMKNAFDMRMQTICMNTALDSIPDLFWIKDIRGAHLQVNNGFCAAVEKTKEQIYKKGHFYIWDIPKEEYDQGDYVCLESEEVVINSRKTCIFDEKVKTKGGMRQFVTYKSPLIDIDGHIFGTCGIANDVTTQHNINSEMEVLLDSMPFGVVIENASGIVVAKNLRFDEFFPDYSNITGKSISQWKENVLKGHAIDKEITVKNGEDEYVLVYVERPIFSIFHENIGNILIITDITKQSKNRKQNILSANTDFLTGLYNRRMLFSHLGLHRCDPHMAMITIDLDNFKKVNDTYGHSMGDRALVDTAGLLHDCFKNDFVARLGGDEFLVVITRELTAEDILAQTEHFLDVLKAHYSSTKEFTVMTASAGIASYTIDPVREKEHDFENLMKYSDSALYRAKKSGKNKCCVFDFSTIL